MHSAAVPPSARTALIYIIGTTADLLQDPTDTQTYPHNLPPLNALTNNHAGYIMLLIGRDASGGCASMPGPIGNMPIVAWDALGALTDVNLVRVANMAKLEGKDVLLVDDDNDIVAAIEAALADLGVAIRTTGNGNTAVEMIQTQTPDLLILDQMLPGRSGFLVLEKIRNLRKETGKPPVIMITANPGARHKVYAETLGVDTYLNKPFRMEKLVTAAKKLLEPEEDEQE